MRKSEIEANIGEIVILDLVNGLEFVTELKRIDLDGYVITSAPWLLFQAELRPKNPQMPPHPKENPISWHIQQGKFGHPVFELDDEKPIDQDHILALHECPEGLKKVYTKTQTGIEIADASVLSQLDAANQPRR